MDCKGFREVLDLYLDGELAPGAATAAQVHEQQCASCQRAARALLRLRQQMKSTIAHQQPPPELVRAVQRISQPRWKRILKISDQRPAPGIGQPAFLSVWRKNITVPLPALALLLIAVALGAWSLSRRIEKTSVTRDAQTLQAIKIAGPQATGEALTFSRFDHGQQAVIYKTRR